MYLVKNISKARQAFYASGIKVDIEPGKDRELDLSQAELGRVKELGTLEAEKIANKTEAQGQQSAKAKA